MDENEIVQLQLENVARGLGFTTVATSGNEVIRWTRVKSYLERYIGYIGKYQLKK